MAEFRKPLQSFTVSFPGTVFPSSVFLKGVVEREVVGRGFPVHVFLTHTRIHARTLLPALFPLDRYSLDFFILTTKTSSTRNPSLILFLTSPSLPTILELVSNPAYCSTLWRAFQYWRSQFKLSFLWVKVIGPIRWWWHEVTARAWWRERMMRDQERSVFEETWKYKGNSY